ncbi:lytic transglycosylase domain-containing protein [Montanilutibacter psychrotolerans]|uniref:Lytic murein transglycosylase n=1 Tax=Montanilutibacter psychrotolerans TaxID=1327343 RepID=A0A3M8SNM5_9GAMM|nr:lytic transglycosylase domain-containing protein [Lysobacter psychrotolerans]RNF82931.1 lytic murein transglycosylase [Lysobacter psychrotolerans]
MATAAAAAPAATRSAPPARVDALLPRVRLALDAAERGDYDAAQYADIVRHPLQGWVEYAALRHNIDAVPASQAQAFLSRYAGQPVAAVFRDAWLAALARREDWTTFATAWQAPAEASSANLGLRCAELTARQVLGRADARWTSDVQAIWRGNGQSLPDGCDAPIAVLAAQGGLTPELRWERFDRAAQALQPAVMRSVARGLPSADQALAEDYAAFIAAPHPRALNWPKTARSRLVASHGLAKLAKDSPASAEAQLPRYADALGFDEADRGRVLYPIALWTVASYEPDSARRLNAVPAASYDDKLHEWRAREAMARSDWAAALTAIRAMPEPQRSDSRWQYFEARLAEKTGDQATATRLYRLAATKPEFHGFLAADRVRADYALCPLDTDAGSTVIAAVARDPSLDRAIALHQLGRNSWAVREWSDMISRLDANQRRVAVDIAQASGWFDRAVFGLGKAPEDLRHYRLRFPLHHDATIRREAATNRLDPAWVAAEIRAESVFDPNARSGANAMGLMQVVPATGAAVAARLGLPWGGAASLYDADTNIVLGTAYLRQLLDQYGGQPYQVLAGYNAGPAPLARWQSQRPGMDPDFWIETISYKETRDYVARVLAFSVVYDWRLNGDALTLSERMRGRLDAPRKRFICPATAAN